MGFYQLILTFIGSVFFTVSAFYFVRVIFIYRQQRVFLYFSLATLGGFLASIFILLLSLDLPPEQILLFHRCKMASMMLCLLFWLWCVCELYLKGSRLPRICAAGTLALAFTVPTSLFISAPARHIQVAWGPVAFDYRLGRTGPAYAAYALLILAVFTCAIVQILRAKLPPRDRALGLLAFAPVIIGGANDYAVVYGLIPGIMIAEYIVFLFLISTFIAFLLMDLQNYQRLQNMTRELEERVQERTAQLQQANTDLRRSNDALVEANQWKSELLGIAAHGLRSPLQGIMGYAELIQQTGHDPEIIRRQASRIHKSSEQMLAMIHDLLETASLDGGRISLKLAAVDLDQLAAAVVEAWRAPASRKEQRISLEAAPCRALTDEGRIREVLENLLSNAVKFSPLGAGIEVRVREDGGRICLEVRDQGPGLSDEDKGKLFSKFTRLSARPTAGEPSTGLGLFIVKRIVEILDGRILVESPPGGGSLFRVELPAAPGPGMA